MSWPSGARADGAFAFQTRGSGPLIWLNGTRLHRRLIEADGPTAHEECGCDAFSFISWWKLLPTLRSDWRRRSSLVNRSCLRNSLEPLSGGLRLCPRGPLGPLGFIAAQAWASTLWSEVTRPPRFASPASFRRNCAPSEGKGGEAPASPPAFAWSSGYFGLGGAVVRMHRVPGRFRNVSVRRLGTNALEFDSAAPNRFVASRLYLVGRHRRNQVVAGTPRCCGAYRYGFRLAKPKIDGHSRSKRSRSA